MTIYSAALIGLLSMGALGRRGSSAPIVGGLGVGVVALAPTLGVGVVASAFFLRRRRAVADGRRSKEDADRESIVLAQSLLIALTAGLSLAEALSSARPLLSSGLGPALDDVRRRALVSGLGPALQTAAGPGARILRQVGSAHASGAPLVLSLGALIHEIQQADRGAALTRARQLPIKMVVPLTLLMMPGFVLLTMGPSALSTFARLVGPIAGL